MAWLTLNRSEKLNALSEGLIDGLAGAGRAFCAAGDLSAFRDYLEDGRTEDLADFIRHISATFTRFETLPQPVFAAVNGLVVAGGLELLLCCDLVVAAPGVRIGDAHLTYGLLPGGGARRSILVVEEDAGDGWDVRRAFAIA